MSTPDDGRKRRHAYIVPDEPAPVLVGDGSPMTRARAVEAVRALRNAGHLRDQSVQLVDYEPSAERPEQVSPRDLGTVDTRYPDVGSQEFRAGLGSFVAGSGALGASVGSNGGNDGLGKYLLGEINRGNVSLPMDVVLPPVKPKHPSKPPKDAA